MNWLQVQVDLGLIPPEPLEEALTQLGAVSIEYRDGGNDPILEPAPGTAPLWAEVKIAALLSADTSETSVRLAIAGSIGSAPMPPIQFSVVEDQDWVLRWQETLHPVRFGKNLWICPADTGCPDATGVAVRLEPGLGFGTGSHPTTAMCLDWLTSQDLAGVSILDFGCGSGILGLSALALGAGHVTAVDIDGQALSATRENALRNESMDRMRVLEAGVLDREQPFDLIIANILSRTLISEEPALRGYSRSGTRIALSGILRSQTAAVSKAYGRWVVLDPPEERRDWAMLAGIAN
jgi:ribosomal protein L11 methyltransferase